MYQKKYDAICEVGPAFEELSENDMCLVDGGGWGELVKATVAVAKFTNVSCAVSATVATCVVTGVYVAKKK